MSIASRVNIGVAFSGGSGRNTMKSGAWAVATVLAAAFTGAASADDGYYRGRRGSYGYEYGYGYDTFRIGLDNGYEEGLREGRRDGERRREYHFSDDRRFRNGDSGYRRSFGPRYEYVRGYRTGYERGYRAGYEASSRYAYGRGYGYGRDRYYKDDRYRGRYWY
jgi:hypothetical protein